jgi:hypothetical protein
MFLLLSPLLQSDRAAQTDREKRRASDRVDYILKKNRKRKSIEKKRRKNREATPTPTPPLT